MSTTNQSAEPFIQVTHSRDRGAHSEVCERVSIREKLCKCYVFVSVSGMGTLVKKSIWTKLPKSRGGGGGGGSSQPLPLHAWFSVVIKDL